MVSVRAPVPQPTSTHDASAATRSQATNSRAMRRLQRPMYGSYAAPADQRSVRITGRTCAFQVVGAMTENDGTLEERLQEERLQEERLQEDRLQEDRTA